MTASNGQRPGRAILGGSFNPPHVGHLRLAVEAREALGHLVQGVDLVPCAQPPHKKTGNLLPFELRAAMLEAALAPLPQLRCNRLEALRDGPSYTWDTLRAYHAAEPGTDFYFLLGSPDFALLPTWQRGLELPRLCHFVVVPRGDLTPDEFMDMTRALWPTASEHPSALPGGVCMALPGGGLAYFLPLPWLAVSASRIRELWLAGRSVDYLVPEAALNLLRTHRQAIAAHWREAQ
ncbi:nicotinate (nicotinamide) nucleotide adenylyltransferase [Desulfovibrio sp. PG-178-WT-4]|uniref:Probable nicotinate-nucleotide adenylyltransferase n=1 Tax=Desulfovibrio porci TaxID=2605782 RepID=A0A6L5XN65_9BACT|nr:nicotinate (nicotinamide) nucleotide adenylyltransferase [Desulfovibrio porci]MSS28637.1 nicotinate (nicotinamide) nucleotide adenylyltransferase [Desulfovibrio porci]